MEKLRNQIKEAKDKNEQLKADLEKAEEDFKEAKAVAKYATLFLDMLTPMQERGYWKPCWGEKRRRRNKEEVRYRLQWQWGS